jgi:hypothetical protein
VGGGDRSLFLALPGRDDRTGEVWALDGEEPALLGDSYLESPGSPGLHVSASGDLFNFGARYLAVWRAGAWKGREIPLGPPDQLNVVDLGPGRPVLFLPRERGEGALWDGTALQAPLAIPPPGTTEARRRLGACALGGDSVLLFVEGGREWSVLRLAGSTLEADPRAWSALAAAPGTRASIQAAVPSGDGGAWLMGRGFGNDKAYVSLYRIAAGKEPVPARAVGEATPRWNAGDFRNWKRSLLPLADGSAWFATEESGLLRLDGDRLEIHGPRRGVSPRGLHWIARGPGRDLFALSDGGALFRWEPGSRPPEGFEDRWAPVRIHGLPLVDPAGRIWMERADRGRRLSRWDGAGWSEIEFSFVGSGLGASAAAADDRDGLILLGDNRRWYCIDGAGRVEFEKLEDAIDWRREAGAASLSCVPEVGVALGAGGRAWASRRDVGRLLLRADGRWDSVEARGVGELLASDDGTRPLLYQSNRWWTWKDGKLEALPDGGGRLPLTVIRAMEDGRLHSPRWIPGLPPDYGRRRLLVPSQDPCFLVSWEEADRAARAGEAPRPSPLRSLDPRPPQDPPAPRGRFHGSEDLDGEAPPENPFPFPRPEWAIPDGDGGFWFRAADGLHRLRGDAHFLAGTEGTPLDGRPVAGVLTDPSGRPWFLLYADGGCVAWFARGRGPAIAGLRAKVLRGRSVLLGRDADPSARYVEVRVAPDGPWRLERGDAPLLWNAPAPGARRLTLEVRAYDALGLAGPPARIEADLGGRFPGIRWSGGAAPRAVNSARWKVPVEAEPAFPEAPLVREVRIDGGEWGPLPASGELLVAPLNNRSVRVEARVVEDGAFASPVLSADVAFETDLDPWIGETIDRALAGAEDAVGDLRSVRKDALRVLEVRIAAAPDRADPLRRLRSRIEGTRLRGPR